MAQMLAELLLHAAFDRPTQTAVEDERGALTYGELADRAGRLASVLNAQGINRGDRVGILLPKSTDSVRAIYGALWSGAAYVPLDVGAPERRLEYMIRNCEMRALITVSRQLARVARGLADSSLACVVVLDADTVADDVGELLTVPVIGRGEIAEQPVLTSPCACGTDDLAYILYTSGSTGNPKGVMISHGNALAFVKWAREIVDARPDDRLSSHAPFHFDLSIFDLYVAAAAGATAVLVPDTATMFPPVLAQWIETQRISIWYSVPSVLVQLMDRGGIDRFSYGRLRRVVFAGEVFASKYLRAWMDVLPAAEWFNFYGPTETNVCTYYKVPPAHSADDDVPIGWPASGDAIVLRDEDGTVLTEPGRVGEIWVDGPTVAMGYWGLPEQTRERFVVDSELLGSDRQMYRTGDLACWNERGELVFHGRRDHMIKSRGYRIELGEIESGLASHADVREACVVAIPDEQLGNRIRAIVVRNAESSLDRGEVEAHLSTRLPRYMLPQEIVFLDALPKTSTGKADRQALMILETGAVTS